MPAFVIQYNRRTGESRVTEFERQNEAMMSRFDLMKDRTDPDVEIVSIIGRSLEAIKKTHSRYFEQDRHLAV